ncbi:rod shape-determining protein MreC [Mongoliitalea daihaiensis]|uniref:rod shape-determining protein MreC n=1 Tax=Mongoliitalea daihaiensis TaxID=2782006 RepID=UPI001F1AF82A|nr:rod shape-determining protein MreC [Mongoliitalea daihaiensis]UJP66067.1 rod shape-determining protein MreC [Mongoliitalea daihaiensis]
MQRIFLFLYRIRAFLLFIALEAIAVFLIVSNNSQQGSAVFNSANQITGNILNTQANVLDYFSLASVNKALVDKNANLLAELEKFKKPADSVYIELDSVLSASFQFKGAKIINNSIHHSQNYLTINRGSNHGIKEGMGVFNEEGVVGRVRAVTKNFASVISLLHTELLVSSKVKSSEVFGSTKWDAKDPKRAKMLYVPRHVNIAVGDEIVTSGYNAVFPEGISIGKVIDVSPGKETNYLDITLELSTDFTRVSYVYLVENNREEELEELYKSSDILDE